MIARVWKGRTRSEDAAAYLDYLRSTGVSDIEQTEGNRAVFVLRRVDGSTAEFLFMSLWESWDAIRRFAGPDPERARYYPRDKDFLLQLEPRVHHYEVCVGSGPGD